MNKFSLKELADIGGTGSDHVERIGSKIVNAPCDCCAGTGRACWCVPRGGPIITHHDGHKFICNICNGIGYQLPKDEEREAFEKWLEANPSQSSNGDELLINLESK